MTKGETTRQRIVVTAATIFNQRGYGAAAISAVMRATGLTKGGIYRHFGNKEQLALEAFEYAWTRAAAARRVGLDEVPDTVDRLTRFVANFVDHRVIPGGCPIFNAAVDSDDGHPRLRAKVREVMRGWIERFTVLVRQGQTRGDVRADVDPADVATVVIATLEGALIMARLDRSREPLRRVQRHLNAFLEQEVRARQTRKDLPKRKTDR